MTTYLSTRDAAERLSVSTDQVVSLIRAGRLPAVNVGVGRKPRWRISEDALETFLAAASYRPKTVARRARKVKQQDVIEFFK